MTRKPYSTQKFKVNFRNSQLLKGWDLNKEKDYMGIILRKKDLYFLAIMNKKNTKVFSSKVPSQGECFEKMIYKQFDATKQVPKCSTELKRVKEAIEIDDKPYYELFDKQKFSKPLTITREIWQLNNLV